MATALLILLGLALIVAPGIVDAPKRRASAARIAEIDAGAKEHYFEERRALVAYMPSRAGWTTRLGGTVAIAYAIARAGGHTLFG